MIRKFIGGPKDGAVRDAETDPVDKDEPEGICIPLGNDRYACYFRVSWTMFTFTEDGHYHFFKIVTGEELQHPNKAGLD